MSAWWISLIAVCTYWHLNEESQAEKFYDKLKSMPQFFDKLNDPLPKSIQSIFKARLLLMQSQPNHKNIEKSVLILCDNATKFLEESLAFGRCKKHNFLINVRFKFIV